MTVLYLIINALCVENTLCFKLTDDVFGGGGEDDFHGDEVLDDGGEVVVLEEVAADELFAGAVGVEEPEDLVL